MTRRDGQLAIERVRGVEVGYWDPLRRTGTWGRPARRPRPIRNFGDLLGPIVVRALVDMFELPEASTGSTGSTTRLLSIGSILHFARDGDLVWGSGFNPKAGTLHDTATRLDVRAVRGPRTAALLGEKLTTPVPQVFGDPGLLLGALRPELLVPAAERTHDLAIVPNLNELADVTDRTHVINPRKPMRQVLHRIARSRLVVGSSLHGIIVAESLGVPARAVRGKAESLVKYEDYFLATGRDPDEMLADDVDDAIARGGGPPPIWDPVPLLEAFPRDAWTGQAADAVAGRAADPAIALIARRLRVIVDAMHEVR